MTISRHHSYKHSNEPQPGRRRPGLLLRLYIDWVMRGQRSMTTQLVITSDPPPCRLATLTPWGLFHFGEGTRSDPSKGAIRETEKPSIEPIRTRVSGIATCLTGVGAIRPPVRAEAVYYLSGCQSRLLFDGTVGSGGALVRHLRVSKRVRVR